jgi:hypothetical protein
MMISMVIKAIVDSKNRLVIGGLVGLNFWVKNIFLFGTILSN